MHIQALPAFTDNLIWMIEDGEELWWVDPGDAAVVIAAAAQTSVRPTGLLLTHHHADHCAGVDELLTRWPHLQIVGPTDERLPWVSHAVGHGDRITLGAHGHVEVIATPGHTRSHHAYLLQYADGDHLFCGDALFSAGCGRLFEGDATDLLLSMSRLRSLQASTQVYAAHEYTAANLAFARALLPDDREIAAYSDFVTSRRKCDQWTLPSTIGREKSINVFFRWDDPAIYRALCDRHHDLADTDCTILAQLRRDKDVFRS